VADESAHAVLPLLEDLLGDDGLAVGNALSMALDEELAHEGLRPLLNLIADHPSAIVRFRASLVRSLLDARNDAPGVRSRADD
jgi:hypothetical protein